MLSVFGIHFFWDWQKIMFIINGIIFWGPAKIFWGGKFKI
jgi:hypothetical protein